MEKVVLTAPCVLHVICSIILHVDAAGAPESTNETEVLVLVLIQYGSSHGAKDMNPTLLSMAGVDWFAKRNGSAGRGVQPVFLCPNALHLPLPPRLFS